MQSVALNMDTAIQRYLIKLRHFHKVISQKLLQQFNCSLQLFSGNLIHDVPDQVLLLTVQCICTYCPYMIKVHFGLIIPKKSYWITTTDTNIHSLNITSLLIL